MKIAWKTWFTLLFNSSICFTVIISPSLVNESYSWQIEQRWESAAEALFEKYLWAKFVHIEPMLPLSPFSYFDRDHYNFIRKNCFYNLELHPCIPYNHLTYSLTFLIFIVQDSNTYQNDQKYHISGGGNSQKHFSRNI